MSLKVALVYDVAANPGAAGTLPADHGAEYEDERTIAALLDAIRACGYESVGVVFDHSFARTIERLGPDVVFNVAEGLRGPARESIVPAWLDHIGIPYTGSDGLTMALTLDKAISKTVAQAHGVATPRWRLVFRRSAA